MRTTLAPSRRPLAAPSSFGGAALSGDLNVFCHLRQRLHVLAELRSFLLLVDLAATRVRHRLHGDEPFLHLVQH
jgi:hypothetical protein